jgi:acetylcholinesterase
MLHRLPLLHSLDLQGLTLAWLPRVDGIFLTEPPPRAVVAGRVADVPIMTGKL